LRAVGAAVSVLLWLWALLALWYWPHCPVWLACVLVLVLSGFGWFCIARVPSPKRWLGLLAAFLVVRLVWEFNQPSNDRSWLEVNARAPVSDFAGDQVTIYSFRSAHWLSRTECDLCWEDRTYDLRQLATVEFLVSPFALNGTMAHTFLTFGFDDGRHVAVSVEIRKEQGESYSPLRGLFRNYETLFVIGEESDLIALRTLIWKNPVYAFPIRTDRARVRALFELLLRDANQLAVRPEWYHTLLNTCHLRLLHHVNALRQEKIGVDWRNYLPGRSDELAWELGLIDFNGSLDEARRRFLLTNPAPWIPDPKEWSRQIRHRPGE
jgi:hypothetical protein